jgi:hypothetical protein
LCFSYYTNDGSNHSAAQQKQGGEFRDVSRWEPAANFAGPTSRAVPDTPK